MIELPELGGDTQVEPAGPPDAEPSGAPRAGRAGPTHAEPASSTHAEPGEPPHAEPASPPHADPALHGLRGELDVVETLAVADRVAVFERVNEVLANELASLDEV